MKRVKTQIKYFLLLVLIYSISTGFAFSQFRIAKSVDLRDTFSQDRSHSIKKTVQEKTESSQKMVDISGIWESSIGWKYNMKQRGNNFSWTVINRDQTALGSIAENDKDIQVTWTENSSKGTTKGLIIDVNEQGKATFIEWDNGVFFHRNL